MTLLFICLAFSCGYILCGFLKKKKLELSINLIGDDEKKIEEHYSRIRELFEMYDEVNSQTYFYKPELGDLEIEDDDEI